MRGKGGGIYLEPVSTSLAGLVTTFVSVKHLYHEAFTGRLHTFVEERLDFIQLLTIHACCKCEFAFNRCESLVQQFSAFTKGLCDHGLAV
jgi:hypothetical protein